MKKPITLFSIALAGIIFGFIYGILVKDMASIVTSSISFVYEIVNLIFSIIDIRKQLKCPIDDKQPSAFKFKYEHYLCLFIIPIISIFTVFDSLLGLMLSFVAMVYSFAFLKRIVGDKNELISPLMIYLIVMELCFQNIIIPLAIFSRAADLQINEFVHELLFDNSQNYFGLIYFSSFLIIRIIISLLCFIKTKRQKMSLIKITIWFFSSMVGDVVMLLLAGRGTGFIIGRPEYAFLSFGVLTTLISVLITLVVYLMMLAIPYLIIKNDKSSL